MPASLADVILELCRRQLLYLIVYCGVRILNSTFQVCFASNPARAGTTLLCSIQAVSFCDGRIGVTGLTYHSRSSLRDA